MSKASVHLALVHWPVLDSTGKVVCTNVTNFDIHDIARASRVYGIKNYFIVNRLKEQLMFVERVVDHWRVGRGSKLNAMRGTALGMIKAVESVEEAIKSFPEPPVVVATAARSLEQAPPVSFKELKAKIGERPILLLFGTGFGLDEQILKKCDYLLEPIKGASADDYRHLSVRSAVSICLDRLLGEW